jgi:DNA phosphorothioation-dependent restriction protein DptG
MKAREKIPQPLEMSCTDISHNYQPYLDALFEMVQDLKVPGRKAKSYE